MIYLDVVIEDFFEDKKGFKVLVKEICEREGYSFNSIKIFKTQKSFGVAIDPKGQKTVHMPHDQKFWTSRF